MKMPTTATPYARSPCSIRPWAGGAGTALPPHVPRGVSRGTMAKRIDGGGLYFEAFAPGATWRTPPRRIAAREMLAYARAWDPLPIHTDEKAASASPHGGLIASGELTFAIVRRALWDLGLTVRAIRIVEQRELRFPEPVRAGDRLTTEARCTGVGAGASPQTGLVTLETRAVNQHGADVLRCIDTLEIPRRPRPAAA